MVWWGKSLQIAFPFASQIFVLIIDFTKFEYISDNRRHNIDLHCYVLSNNGRYGT